MYLMNIILTFFADHYIFWSAMQRFLVYHIQRHKMVWRLYFRSTIWPISTWSNCLGMNWFLRRHLGLYWCPQRATVFIVLMKIVQLSKISGIKLLAATFCPWWLIIIVNCISLCWQDVWPEDYRITMWPRIAVIRGIWFQPNCPEIGGFIGLYLPW